MSRSRVLSVAALRQQAWDKLVASQQPDPEYDFAPVLDIGGLWIHHPTEALIDSDIVAEAMRPRAEYDEVDWARAPIGI